MSTACHFCNYYVYSYKLARKKYFKHTKGCITMYDITSLGELLIDFTHYGISDNNQILFEQNPGGAPVNVLATASKFHLNTAFIGKVGSDIQGLFLKSVLEELHIHTEGLILDDSVFTTLAFVSLDSTGERTFSFARKPGADLMLRKEEVNISIIENSKIFHIGSLSLTSNPSREATFHALETAKQSGSLISYDPNYRAALWENRSVAIKHMKSVLPYVDLIKISDSELDILTPYSKPEKAASYLIEQGISLVAITLGEKGSYIQTKKQHVYAEGYQSDVVDTTGAGDSFWGAFLYSIINAKKDLSSLTSKELYSFARFSNATSSLCIKKRGAIPALPSLNDVMQLF